MTRFLAAALIAGHLCSSAVAVFSASAVLAPVVSAGGAAASVSTSLWPQRWSAHLDRDVLPFWLAENERTPSPDNPDAEMRSRFLSLQLRSLYVLAAAISRETDPDARRHLRSLLARRQTSVVARFRDARAGDWFSTESAAADARDGDTTPPVPKTTADQAWAMLLLADIHTLAGVPDALRLARETFARVDPLAHDDLYGGYFVEYDSSPPDAPGRASRTGRIRDHESSRKHASTQLHMLLALARLLRSDPQDSLVRTRLEELFALVPRFVSPDTGHVRWALGRDWQPAAFARPVNNRTLYGQNAEAISYLLDAADALGRPPADILPVLESIAGGLIRDGISDDGAVYYTGPMTGPADDRRVWWWPQIETAAALWRLHRLTGRDAWLAGFEQVSAWAFARLVPPENPGRWHTLCTADGQPLPHTAAAHEIQTGFHVVRSLLVIGKN
ncbi:N-acyl-D-glucosamine 2-epimerase [Opitutaceae bacterium TAV1]|nr:N-acyl-D-glucosamine 2-epimerase [Opitutaceae bacterium TAV1]